jgi:DNA-binding transcriptional ArsR family regulator
VKRDLDLIRRILLATEEAPDFTLSCSDLASDDLPLATVAQHVQLLQEAGYLEANLLDLEGQGVLDGTIDRLTWAGHEFLEAARDNSVCKRPSAQ